MRRPGICLRGGDGDVGLNQAKVIPLQRERDGLEAIACARRKHGLVADEERTVRTDRCYDRLQFIGRQTQLAEIIY